MIRQKTIAVDVSYTGIGLHSGTEVNMKLRPAPVDTGIVFIRTDLPEKTQIKAIASNVTSTLRATTISNGDVKIFTIEHLMSALFASDIDNCYIEIDSEEPPVTDGSANVFLELLEKAGIKEIPNDAEEMLNAARKIKESGAEEYPISLPLSADAGTTTPWFMLTKSMGGELFDENYKPIFTDKESAGYKAMKWVMEAYKEELVNPAAVDYQGTDVVDHYKNADGSIDIAGWSGNVTEYFNEEKSSIANDVEVIKVPGANGKTRTYSLLEGVGIPSSSEHKEAAAEFIKYINTEEFLKTFFTDYGIFPSSKKVIDSLIESGELPGGKIVSEVLGTIEPLVPQGAPEWYGTWEGEAATIMNQMAKGELNLDEGLQAIAESAEKLNSEK